MGLAGPRPEGDRVMLLSEPRLSLIGRDRSQVASFKRFSTGTGVEDRLAGTAEHIVSKKSNSRLTQVQKSFDLTKMYLLMVIGGFRTDKKRRKFAKRKKTEQNNRNFAKKQRKKQKKSNEKVKDFPCTISTLCPVHLRKHL